MAADGLQEKIKKFFDRRHPAYTKHFQTWEKVYRAYHGGAAFVQDNRFLWAYEAEEDGDWQERSKRSAYENHTRSIIERRENIIFSRRIQRDPVNVGMKEKRLDEFNEDVDLQGTSRNDFVRQCFHLSQIFGWLPVLLDKRSGEADTGAQEAELGLRPYAKAVLPFDFLNWRVGEDEALEWIVVRMSQTVRGEPMEEERKVVEYRFIDRVTTQVWEERDKKDGGKEYVMLPEVTHNLGIVPVVFLYDLRMPNEEVVGFPSLLGSVDLSIQLFNYASWSEEIAYKTLYTMLAAPEDSGTGEKEKKVGPSYIFHYDAQDGKPPEWISPPVTSIETLRAEIKDMRRQIYELAQLDAGHAEDKREELSGVAYSLRRKPTEEMAKRLGRCLETFEIQLERMVMNVFEEDGEFEPGIVYPKRYAVRDTLNALEQQRIVEESTTIPPAVKALLASRIVMTEDFAELSDDELEELEEQIKAYDPQAAEVEQARKLKRAEVEEQIPLEEKKIEAGKQHSLVMADKALQVERLRAEAELKKEKLKVEAEKSKPKEAPKATPNILEAL